MDITTIQKQLQNAGQNHLVITGKMDTATRQAIANVNKANGLAKGIGTSALAADTIKYLSKYAPKTTAPTTPTTPIVTTPTTPITTAPTTPAVDIAGMIKDQYAQALAAKTAAINKATDTTVNGYNQQIQGADGQYQPLRNDASYQGSKSLQGLKENMAQQGLFNSGDNLTGQMNINNNTASNINSLNTQQQDYVNKLNQSIAQARANAEADISSATADTTAQKLSALVNQANADKTFDYQKGRDTISDNRYNTEYTDSRADRASDVSFRDKQYTDSRTDAKYNKDMTAKQYRDNQNWLQRNYKLDAPIKQLQAQQLAQAMALAKQNALKNSGSGGGGRSSKGSSSRSSSRSSSGSSSSGGGMSKSQAERLVNNQLNQAIKNHTGRDFVLNNKSAIVKQFGQSYYNSLMNKYVPYNANERRFDHAVNYNMRPR